jgi:tRNA/tmRNA/rRNA uracil-C5-methylase (TrmA/RlmC/RlmD family)
MTEVTISTSGSWVHACEWARLAREEKAGVEYPTQCLIVNLDRIYTSGIISDPTKFETLEQLQDNKLALVCEKLDLKPSDRLLDIGCGWGTLAAYAGKNYGCDVTGGEPNASCARGLSLY